MALPDPMTDTESSLRGPLQHLESQLLNQQGDIEAWFRRQWLQTPAPFYASVDLRNAGYKLAPVDTNLFPAGFNNLAPEFEPLCIQALQSAVDRICPTARSLMVIPENHTRNRFYLENVARLVELMRKAGFDVRIGSLMPDLKTATDIELDSGRPLRLEPIVRQGNKLGVEGFSPCGLILNNDLSSGQPDILAGVEQPIMPPPTLGWDHRTKSEHFTVYSQVAGEFAESVGIDRWLIDPLFRNCGQINFMKREGEESLASNVEMLLASIRQKYDEYGISDEPYVVIKSDAGTYGMDILVRCLRFRLVTSSGEEGRDVTGAIIQEGVYTREQWGAQQASAESVLYMIDRFVVGGFYRVHTGRNTTDSLNAPGMEFHPLPFADGASRPDPQLDPDAGPNRFHAYGVVARLALVAAAREIAQSGTDDE